MEKEKDLSLIVCSLKDLRQKKGYTQSQLADLLGIKRQAVYDIESGRYLPNTLIALRLARILGVTIEDIFEEKVSAVKKVELLGDTPVNSRVSVARVRDKYIAYSSRSGEILTGTFQAADGLYLGNGTVQFLKNETLIENTILLLGCDPVFNILASYITASDTAMEYRFASSRAALEAVAAGHAHVAGIHMHSKTGDPSSANVEFAHRIMGNQKIGMISFAEYEEGLIVAPGNPLKIRNVDDFINSKVRFINREPGAAVRFLIEDILREKGISPSDISGFDKCVYSHEEGARLVSYGLADVALGFRFVADLHQLDFVPLSSVKCDLVIPSDLWDIRPVRILIDALQGKRLRLELQSLAGYSTESTGKITVQP